MFGRKLFSPLLLLSGAAMMSEVEKGQLPFESSGNKVFYIACNISTSKTQILSLIGVL